MEGSYLHRNLNLAVILSVKGFTAFCDSCYLTDKNQITEYLITNGNNLITGVLQWGSC